MLLSLQMVGTPPGRVVTPHLLPNARDHNVFVDIVARTVAVSRFWVFLVEVQIIRIKPHQRMQWPAVAGQDGR
jgi:hypothetical protein